MFSLVVLIIGSCALASDEPGLIRRQEVDADIADLAQKIAIRLQDVVQREANANVFLWFYICHHASCIFRLFDQVEYVSLPEHWDADVRRNIEYLDQLLFEQQQALLHVREVTGYDLSAYVQLLRTRLCETTELSNFFTSAFQTFEAPFEKPNLAFGLRLSIPDAEFERNKVAFVSAI